jgi:hypothetical protein
MNRAIELAAVYRYKHDGHAQLRQHLIDFIPSHNLGRVSRSLKASRLLSSSANAGHISPDDSTQYSGNKLQFCLDK